MMRRNLPILLLLFCMPIAGIADVYKWVDEDGQLHFSDMPQDEDAEIVELQNAQTFEAPAAPRRPRRSIGGQSDGAQFQYDALEIVSPTQEQVFWNNEGQLDVSIRLKPNLRAGHSLQLSLDGQIVDERRRLSGVISLANVTRGQHNLTARVFDNTGASLIQADAVTFNVQQTSVLNTNNPNNIPPPTPSPRAGP